jgi:hypothetical protein
MKNHRRHLLTVAREILVFLRGKAPRKIRVTVEGGGVRVVVVSRPGECDGPEELGELHRVILSHATSEPRSAKALARLCGYAYSPRFRGAIADLVRGGKLLRMPEGLKLATRD